MKKRRTDRLNSLLKEVISEVIHRDVRNPHLPELVTVTHVNVTPDLRFAKVYISVIGTPADKQKAIMALQSAAGFIATNASKKMVIRYFPDLTFTLDDSVEQHMRIESLLTEINDEQKRRSSDHDKKGHPD
jgi:ribosome-binding factor A